MINELKDYLNKGGEKVFTRYAVEIGDALWEALYSHVEGTYGIESVCEDSEQKFAVLTADGKYYRLNLSISEENVVEFAAEAELLEEYVPAEEPQFSVEAVEEYAKKKNAKPADEEEEEEDKDKKCPKCGKPASECHCDDDDEDEDDDDDKNKKKKDKKSKYNLEEVQEYVELSEKYSTLETEYSNAQSKIAELEAQVNELTTFKKGIEKAEKEKMIASFYMLSDEDKKDVIDNIDTYSLDDIEAKLSIICVRNKVSFNLEDDNSKDDPTVFSLNGNPCEENVPAWVKALRRTVAEN
jgi:hypothetical protein